eukprot:CAMPEP_0198239008 /NCGR_PEP_ID=MMETSP1446-20131203/4535_1 /TAXON_ID=1461542 ORGANISM="Unidentified sp, Strain CCMP2111" /NCGR_SAMPLE_ID=MMETSP1446 /ASSEMBLY_ACC=CAM_ASM_001112 /LENGTH=137 /DNA_ID=CAMNT_0043921531 /DNA_START=3 /DNA_END=416 /DNA_ORIENTATION=+
MWGKSDEFEEIRSEIRDLKRKAEALNSPETFAESAKLTREVRALEKQLGKRVEARAIVKAKAQNALSSFKWLLILVLIASTWKKPLVSLASDGGLSLWPISILLKFPDCYGIDGTVISTFWLCIAFHLMARILRDVR